MRASEGLRRDPLLNPDPLSMTYMNSSFSHRIQYYRPLCNLPAWILQKNIQEKPFSFILSNILDILILYHPNYVFSSYLYSLYIYIYIIYNSTNILKIKPYFQTIMPPCFFSLTQFSIRIQLLKVTLVLFQSSYTHRTTGWPLSWQ